MTWHIFYDCHSDSSWRIAKVSILTNYKQNTPQAMGRFICLMRLPPSFSLPVAQRRNRMNNTKKGDSGAKLIFGNEELVSQLLRNYSGLEILKDVQAEDIEDVTDKFVPMFEEERDSDVVKKIHLKGNEKPFFLISLIEHKSRVDYNVIMQLLRYMVFIWIDYEREMKKQTGNKDIARTAIPKAN